MTVIEAVEVSERSLAGLGRIVRLDGTPADGVRVTATDAWTDAHGVDVIVDQPGSLGRTSTGRAPFDVEAMERHPYTEEALFDPRADLVLAVAGGSGPAPRTADVVALVIPAGTAIVLDRGVWHDACRGLTEPTSYVWLATCGLGVPEGWVPLDGGPVHVSVDAALAARR